MKKKLSERIAERAKEKKNSRNSKNRAQFFNVRDEIEEALGENWTIQDIWETLHAEGLITYSYNAFRNHVNIWKNSKKESNRPEKKPEQNNQKAPGGQSTENKTTEQKKGFFINNSPNKEDLI